MNRNDEALHSIEREMAQIRTSIQSDVKQAVDHAKELTDWRTHVRRHPWVVLGVASAAGFLVGWKSRQTTRSRQVVFVSDAAAKPTESVTMKPTPSLWQNVTRWAIGYAVRNAVQWATQQAAQRVGAMPDGDTAPKRTTSPREPAPSDPVVVPQTRLRNGRDFPNGDSYDR